MTEDEAKAMEKKFKSTMVNYYIKAEETIGAGWKVTIM